MKRPAYFLSLALATSLPLMAAAAGKKSATKPAPRVVRVSTESRASRSLVAVAGTPGQAGSATPAVVHKLGVEEAYVGTPARDRLTFFKVRPDGVVWDAAQRGSLTPQRARRILRGKAIKAQAREESLTTSVVTGSAMRVRQYETSAAHDVGEPLIIKRTTPSGRARYEPMPMVKGRALVAAGYANGGVDAPVVKGNLTTVVPYANANVIGATRLHQPVHAKSATLGAARIRVRGGLNALTPGSAYQIRNLRTNKSVASGFAHQETGSFRADLKVTDYEEGDAFSLIVVGEGGGKATYELSLSPEAAGTAANALRPVRLQATGTEVDEARFARAQREVLGSLERLLASRDHEPEVADQVRRGLEAYRGGRATPAERLALLTAITARIDGLHPDPLRQGPVRLLDVRIGDDVITFHVARTDGSMARSTQTYTLAP